MKKKTILICTQNPGLKQILQESLAHNYICVFYSEASNLPIKAVGADACRVIVDLSPDYSSSAYEIERFKINPISKGIPVIVLSSDKTPAPVLKATRADYLISKPFSIEELYRVLRGERSQQKELASSANRV